MTYFLFFLTAPVMLKSLSVNFFIGREFVGKSQAPFLSRWVGALFAGGRRPLGFRRPRLGNASASFKSAVKAVWSVGT